MTAVFALEKAQPLCPKYIRSLFPQPKLYLAQMATPTTNYVAVCANANIPLVGTKAAQLTLLKDSGVPMPAPQTNADIKERCATLTRARHAVANSIDPTTWTTMLSGRLLTALRTLYAIPPTKPNAPPTETDLHLLAHMVTLYLQDDVIAPPTASSLPLPSAAATGINTQRPPGSAQCAVPAICACRAGWPRPAALCGHQPHLTIAEAMEDARRAVLSALLGGV